MRRNENAFDPWIIATLEADRWMRWQGFSGVAVFMRGNVYPVGLVAGAWSLTDTANDNPGETPFTG